MLKWFFFFCKATKAIQWKKRLFSFINCARAIGYPLKSCLSLEVGIDCHGVWRFILGWWECSKIECKKFYKCTNKYHWT